MLPGSGIRWRTHRRRRSGAAQDLRVGLDRSHDGRAWCPLRDKLRGVGRLRSRPGWCRFHSAGGHLGAGHLSGGTSKASQCRRALTHRWLPVAADVYGHRSLNVHLAGLSDRTVVGGPDSVRTIRQYLCAASLDFMVGHDRVRHVLDHDLPIRLRLDPHDLHRLRVGDDPARVGLLRDTSSTHHAAP